MEGFLFLREAVRVDLDAAAPRKQCVQCLVVICKVTVSFHMRENNVLCLGIRCGGHVQNTPDEIQHISASAAWIKLQQHVAGVAKQCVFLALHLTQNRLGRFLRAVNFASGIQRESALLLCLFLLKQFQAMPVSIVTSVKAVRRAGDVPDALSGFHL